MTGTRTDQHPAQISGSWSPLVHAAAAFKGCVRCTLLTMTTTAKKCHHVRVPPDACLIQFSDDRMAYAKLLGFTARGDELWAHCDAAEKILEIQLLADDKPCQQDTAVPDASSL